MHPVTARYSYANKNKYTCRNAVSYLWICRILLADVSVGTTRETRPSFRTFRVSHCLKTHFYSSSWSEWFHKTTRNGRIKNSAKTFHMGYSFFVSPMLNFKIYLPTMLDGDFVASLTYYISYNYFGIFFIYFRGKRRVSQSVNVVIYTTTVNGCTGQSERKTSQDTK